MTSTFQPGEKIIYARAFVRPRKETVEFKAEFICTSRKRAGYAVIVVDAGSRRYRDIVRLTDLKHIEPVVEIAPPC